MDLVCYLLRMNVFKAGMLSHKKYKLFANEDFPALADPSFRFLLFGSFESAADTPFVPILQQAHELAQHHRFSNFGLVLRDGTVNHDHWDESFYKKHVPSDATRIYIVGPEPFVSSTTAALVRLGHDKRKLNYF